MTRRPADPKTSDGLAQCSRNTRHHGYCYNLASDTVWCLEQQTQRKPRLKADLSLEHSNIYLGPWMQILGSTPHCPDSSERTTMRHGHGTSKLQTAITAPAATSAETSALTSKCDPYTTLLRFIPSSMSLSPRQKLHCAPESPRRDLRKHTLTKTSTPRPFAQPTRAR